MRSSVTAEFRKRLRQLPSATRKQANRAYRLWRVEPFHSSLQFKRVSSSQTIYSVRIGLGHRALGLRSADQIDWFWIGSHAEYDELLRRL